MRALLIVAALAAAPALADDMVFKDDNVTVRLTEAPCTRAAFQTVLAQVKPDPAKVAVVTHGGRYLAACWLAHPESGNVVLIDEEGDAGLIPMADFKREPGV
jgi:hypothetical protein